MGRGSWGLQNRDPNHRGYSRFHFTMQTHANQSNITQGGRLPRRTMILDPSRHSTTTEPWAPHTKEIPTDKRVQTPSNATTTIEDGSIMLETGVRACELLVDPPCPTMENATTLVDVTSVEAQLVSLTYPNGEHPEKAEFAGINMVPSSFPEFKTDVSSLDIDTHMHDGSPGPKKDVGNNLVAVVNLGVSVAASTSPVANEMIIEIESSVRNKSKSFVQDVEEILGGEIECELPQVANTTYDPPTRTVGDKVENMPSWLRLPTNEVGVDLDTSKFTPGENEEANTRSPPLTNRILDDLSVT